MLHYRNYLYQLRRRTFGAPPLGDVVAQTIVVSQDEFGVREPATHLPGQPERVRGIQPETTKEHEQSRISGGPVHHVATLAYRIPNAHYFDGNLYAGGLRWRQVIRPESRAIWARSIHLDECALPSTSLSDKYFGHFLRDVAATAILAETFAPTFFARGTFSAMWPHAKEYYEILKLNFPVLDAAVIRNAWIFQDYGMTESRRARITALRERAMALGGDNKDHRVFITRRASGDLRLLANEAEIEDRLLKEGFEVVDPSRLSAPEIIRKICGATLICSVEGSGLAHGFLSMAPKGAILAIQPPYRFNNIWKDYADAMDMRYGFVVGEGSESTFSVSPDEILKTADLLLPRH